MSLLLIISFLFFISVNEVSSFGVDERDCLTKIINGQRSTIAQGKLANLPTASDMNRLEYSKLFEGMAQSLARDCSMHHLGGGVSHFTSDKIYEKNEDLFQEAISVWSSESKDLDNNLKPNENAKNFAQVFYSKNKQFGCGKFTCSGKTFFVCYFSPYGPSQTLYGPVYNKGEICGNCEHNNCNKESGLCIPVINKLIID